MPTAQRSNGILERTTTIGGPCEHQESIYVACASLLPDALADVAASKGLTFIQVQRELDEDAVLVRVAAAVPLLTQSGRAFTCLLSHTDLTHALLYDRRLAGLALADVQELLTEQRASLLSPIVLTEREAAPNGAQTSMQAASSQEQAEQHHEVAPAADSELYVVGPTIVLSAECIRDQWSQRQRHRLPSARQLPRLLLRAALTVLVQRCDQVLVRRLLAWQGPGRPEIQVRALSRASCNPDVLYQIRVYVPVACAA
jgi:hypothetical protein